MSTTEQIFDIRMQLQELEQQVAEWRKQLTWQEEVAFFAAKTEELTRRLSALEKRIAHERLEEPVTIRFSQEPVATW